MSVEAAAAQDRGFERELRREADAHLLVGRRLAGLVVEDGVAAVGEPLDAVGAGAQRERALAERNLDLAADLGMRAPRRPARRSVSQPANQRAMRWKRGHQNARASGKSSARRNACCAERDQRGARDRPAALSAKALRELADRAVDDGAAVGGAGRRVDGDRARAARGCAWRRSYRGRAASARSR